MKFKSFLAENNPFTLPGFWGSAFTVVFTTLVATAVSLSLSAYVENRLERSVFVSAETTRLSLRIKESKAPLPLGPVVLCLQRAEPVRAVPGDAVMTCSQGGSIAVRPDTPLPGADRVTAGNWTGTPQWPAAYVFDPPAGTKVFFEIVGDFVEITIAELPVPQSDGLVEGARLILPLRSLADRNRYVVLADLELGSPPSTSQRGYLKTGDISFRARAITAFYLQDGASILLRRDTIPLGGYVTFENARTDAPNPMNVQLVADRGQGVFLVDAVNAPGPTVAHLQYVGTQPLRLVPLWTDLIVNDPLIALLSVLAGLLGFRTFLSLKRFKARRKHL